MYKPGLVISPVFYPVNILFEGNVQWYLINATKALQKPVTFNKI